MATKTTFYNAGGIPSNGQVVGVKHAIVDLAQDTATPLVNDIYELFEIGTNELPLAAGYEILTVDAGGGAVEIGIDGDATIDTVADISALASAGDSTAPAFEAGTVTAQVITAAATTLKIRVWVVVANVQNPAEVVGLETGQFGIDD